MLHGQRETFCLPLSSEKIISGQPRILPFFRYTPNSQVFNTSSSVSSQFTTPSFSSQMEAATADPAAKRCAVVTGGNKGIGLEICRQLASNGVVVILTARDDKRGIEAVENLTSSGLSNVLFHQLDVKDPASVATLANYIGTRFGKLDILVNNAGAVGVTVDTEALKASIEKGEVIDEFSSVFKRLLVQTYEKAEECIKTNYYGTKAVTEALLPLLQLSASARIVNVSSSYGQLKLIPNENVKAELDNIDCLTEERLDELIQAFLRDFKEDRLNANGWPLHMSAYTVSKVAMNAYTRILARKFSTIYVNCVHPGFAKTDLTFYSGILTAEEGAKAPVMLALLRDGGPSGLFFDQLEPASF